MAAPKLEPHRFDSILFDMPTFHAIGIPSTTFRSCLKTKPRQQLTRESRTSRTTSRTACSGSLVQVPSVEWRLPEAGRGRPHF